MPVVIRFSSAADCRVMSGIVTTPPPRPSRSTRSTLMTVMVARLQRRPGTGAARACILSVPRRLADGRHNSMEDDHGTTDEEPRGKMRLPALTELTPRQQEV